ncbi:MAG: amidohydrolase [Bacteroidales bacterium]|nr:amidohydrolase [Bacteroidales bacterium]
MKRFCIIFLLTLSLAALASGGRIKKTPASGLKYLDTHFHLYDSLQKRIWNYAETGYTEFRSAEQWASFLESQGFSVERGVAGIPTAFVATFGSGSPVIGVLAEYDALPGMSQDTVPYRKPLLEGANGHGCGHNLLGTGSVAGAVAISKWLSEGHAGTVKLFGCPAEEGGGGKAYMMREKVFDGTDAMLDWHPDTRNTVNRTSGLANVQVQFNFYGRSSHASGAPEEGRSALDAVESLDYMMNLMREHVPQTTRIHYVITNGGKAPNVVPDQASVKYYLRSPSRKVVGELLERALDAARGAAMGTGTTMDYELLSGNYERLPNDAMADLVGRSLEKTGGLSLNERELEFARAVAAESGVSADLIDGLSVVVPPSEQGYEAYVSSDVGNVTWAVPTGSFRYACFAPGGVGHSWQQVASGGTTIGTKGALGAARVIYLSAYELFTDAGLLDKVRSEFIARRGENFRFEPLMGNRRPPFMEKAELSAPMPAVGDIRSNARRTWKGDLERWDGMVSLQTEARMRLLKAGRKFPADTTGLDIFLRSSGITNQRASGRCWFFATANVLRGENRFSQSYAYFFDLLEKANLFLVRMWDARKEPLDSRLNEALLRRPTWDGGQFMNAVYLIDKYGLVPAEVMEDSFDAQHSADLLRELRSLLRSYGLRMRQTSEPEDLRLQALSDVYGLLCSTLGTPPAGFEWEGKKWTPAAWRDSLGLGGLARHYAVLMNDPSRPYYKMYRVCESRSAADAPEWTFLNMPAEELEGIGLASLRGGDRFYFTADTYKDFMEAQGVYDLALSCPGSAEGGSWYMDKEELFLSRDVSSAHAMAMCGVKLSDGSGVERWVAENSFGEQRGRGGYVTMRGDWWRRYMFRMAVDRKYLPASVSALLDQTPEPIPWWNLY